MMERKDGEENSEAPLVASSPMPVKPSSRTADKTGKLKAIVRFIARRAAERDFAKKLETIEGVKSNSDC
ncbi:MAG: hypothetical protein AAGI03_05595 [Pseudomonadota bacterium]